MRKTTLRLDDELLRRAKAVAAQSGQTLTALIEESVRERLARRAPKRGKKRVKLITDGSGGVAPGIDLDDSAALLDLMEEVDGPLRR